jgi:hypothetical protein
LKLKHIASKYGFSICDLGTCLHLGAGGLGRERGTGDKIGAREKFKKLPKVMSI